MNTFQIAGTIGTGLFLGSGGAIATAGPLSALIAYVLVGTVAYGYVILLSLSCATISQITDRTLCSLGEMTTWAPISGTYPHFGTHLGSAISYIHSHAHYYSWSLGGSGSRLRRRLGKLLVY